MSSSPPPSRRGPDISAAQVAGSALAAVSAAVVASFLGVGGTIIGAALGSLVASIGGAVYSQSFQRAGYKLGETKVLTVVTRARLGPHEPGEPTDPGHPGPSDVPVIEDPVTDDGAPGAESGAAGAGVSVPTVTTEPPKPGPLPPPGGRIPRWLSWKAAVALTVVAFVLAVAVISLTEFVLGRPISGGSGGTTISHLVKPGKTTHPTPKPTTPLPSSTTTPVPTPATPAPSISSPTISPTTPLPSGSTTGPIPTSTPPVSPSTTPAS
jgi:hypothetical protein